MYKIFVHVCRKLVNTHNNKKISSSLENYNLFGVYEYSCVNLAKKLSLHWCWYYEVSVFIISYCFILLFVLCIVVVCTYTQMTTLRSSNIRLLLQYRLLSSSSLSLRLLTFIFALFYATIYLLCNPLRTCVYLFRAYFMTFWNYITLVSYLEYVLECESWVRRMF